MLSSTAASRACSRGYIAIYTYHGRGDLALAAPHIGGWGGGAVSAVDPPQLGLPIYSYPYSRYVYTEGQTVRISLDITSNAQLNVTAELHVGALKVARAVLLHAGNNKLELAFKAELPQGIYTPWLALIYGNATLLNETLPPLYVLNTTGKPPLSLVIVWNMHQPLYIEPNGTWAMPWVLLHTGEDFVWNRTLVGAYELQAMLLSEFDVNVTIDFTPVLLYQWEALLAEGPRGFRYIGEFPGNLTHDLRAIRRTLELYRELAREGRVEVMTVPFYHPLEAILYDEGWGEDILAQLIMGKAETYRVFGVNATCVWTPEMAFNMGLVHLYNQAGLNCTVLDADAFLSEATFINGTPTPYVPYVVEDAAGNYIYVLFRDTGLSNLFWFYFTLSDPSLVQQLLIQYLAKVYMQHPGAVVVVALDGENPLIENPYTGPRDLYAIYQALDEYSGRWLITQTVSQAIATHVRYAVTNLPESSWNLNLNNWNNGYPGKIMIWRKVAEARAYLSAFTGALGMRPSPVVTPNPADAPNSTDLLSTLWNYLYAAEGSDWTWQTGPPNFGPRWFSVQPLILTNAIIDAVRESLGRVKLVGVSSAGPYTVLEVYNGLNSSLHLRLGVGQRCEDVHLEPGLNFVEIQGTAQRIGVYLPQRFGCGLKIGEWTLPRGVPQTEAWIYLAPAVALAVILVALELRRAS
ncbi:Alpha-amylase/alpha-mannosidase [Thermoproteus tenax Kra 1]|uniref:Alpha-amylase/alpha-mannosidase n=1 Tax=Thermoproteus tenax (strain ATCC 35583 / DSM 2078 / JCM 9277 / NBRC 100435 / Kra 1) TaxID=768679 RepID=G4RLF6_THETK|nr:Alpha-amylase/alpha-mannosidase [Thermoproteus tenax Kra 1]